MKLTLAKAGFTAEQVSLPVRGAWVEMATARFLPVSESRRSPCGERGLK